MTLAHVLAALVGAAGADSLAVIGAVARNAWAPPRATTDLDLAVSASASTLAAAEAALAALGYQCVRRQQADPADPLPDMLIFRAETAGLRQVDLLVAKTDFEREALRRATPVVVGERAVPVATPEDLIVYKLLADRPRDRDDIRAIVRTQTRAGRVLDWGYVETWSRYWSVTNRLRALRAEIGPSSG